MSAPNLLRILGALLLCMVAALLLFRMDQSFLVCERGKGSGDVCVLTRTGTLETTVAAISVSDIRQVEVETYSSRRPYTSTFILVTSRARVAFSSRYCGPPSQDFAEEVRAFLRNVAERELVVEYDCRPEVLPHMAIYFVIGATMLGGGFLWQALDRPASRYRRGRSGHPPRQLR